MEGFSESSSSQATLQPSDHRNPLRAFAKIAVGIDHQNHLRQSSSTRMEASATLYLNLPSPCMNPFPDFTVTYTSQVLKLHAPTFQEPPPEFPTPLQASCMNPASTNSPTAVVLNSHGEPILIPRITRHQDFQQLRRTEIPIPTNQNILFHPTPLDPNPIPINQHHPHPTTSPPQTTHSQSSLISVKRQKSISRKSMRPTKFISLFSILEHQCHKMHLGLSHIRLISMKVHIEQEEEKVVALTLMP
ncbi:hypothetical protein L6452_30802 [Arctium lappa]|uniref:Uncharacterized protein n=1 Tax=Arctium lappa TaxID=4217 RepID=A0ACB8ZNJ8_ARCLA|nr:hypothetical protein L6452_30802 [Arctium lappa]